MSRKACTVCLFLGLVVLLAAAAVVAAEKTTSERWYALYYEGKKHGRSHVTFADLTEGGAAMREVDASTYLVYRGSKTSSGAKGSKTKHYTFNLKADHTITLKDGKVIALKASRTGTRSPVLRAKAVMDGDVLVLERTEGVVDETLRIKPDDYDLTTDPSQMEPFLETVTPTPVVKKVFSFADAEVRDQTYVRLGDDTARDVDGVKKPCKKFKMTDEDGESILKTVDGKIVYHKRRDERSDSVIKYYWTFKQIADSDAGF